LQSPNKTLVITATNERFYKQYSHRFHTTFREINPTLDLEVWSETDLPIPYNELPTEWYRANEHRPKPRSMLYDGVRFHWKPLAVYCATERLYKHQSEEYDSILWIDSDTVFLNPIDQTWIDTHLRKPNTIMSYMGRPHMYSECGLLFFDFTHSWTRNYITSVWRQYEANDFWQLPEQHDSYIWDYIRKRYEANENYDLAFYNLNKDNVKVSHIQAHLFGRWFDHTKGKRKLSGKSKENPHNK